MLNIAIIGTGNIAPSHVQGYLQFSDRCKIVALVDIYPDKARKMAERFELDADIYGAHEDLLKRKDIHLVSVCTPPYTHAEITINCLQAGFHVLVEKPMAASLAECDAMLAAAENNGRLLSVIAQNRFTNPIMKLKQILDLDVIGKITHAQVDSFWWRGANYYDLWWRGTWEKEGGGCTLNHAVHHIDALQWMMGSPQQVLAKMTNVSHPNSEVEDLSIAILVYPDGALGQITSSVVHHGEEQQLILQGERARVSFPWKIKACLPRENGFPIPNLALEEQIQAQYDALPDLAYQGHAGQIANMLDAIQNREPLLITGAAGRDTLELITAIYASSVTKTTTSLPLDHQNPFYTREGILKHALYFHEKTKHIENFTDDRITVSGENH